MTRAILTIGPDHHLTPGEVHAIAHNPGIKVVLSSRARAKLAESRGVVDSMVAERKIVYGVTTGFGSFKNKAISRDDVAALQKNLIRSHSVGVGPALPAEVVRACFLVRLNSLAQGYSGVRLELVDLLTAIINKNIIPFVPSQGSVGSSGDLVPLSHMGLILMGEGRAWYKGELMAGDEALGMAGLSPLVFAAKEGLAFNNGTSAMTGIAALAIHDAERLVAIADMGCALTLEAVCGVTGAFDERVHMVRPHPGQAKSAENIRKFIRGSKLINSVPSRVQDGYSLRCAPQVHGAIRDAIAYAKSTVERELNSVTDNPLIFSEPRGEAISGGNFHGEPIAIAMDTLGIAISELANISERRTARLVNSETNEGLPLFLIARDKAGLHSGLMIPQYTAAALVSENKILAHPASVDSIPTSANQEDHVSMGTIAARKALNILQNTENVLAIEYLTATQAIDFRQPEKLGKFTKLAYAITRRRVPMIKADRELHKDVTKIREMFSDEEFIGKLGL